MNKIEETALNERPYEKCKNLGPENLSDSELLAIILRTGYKDKSVLDVSKEIIGDNKKSDRFLTLSRMSIKELTKLPGIGEVKAIQLSSIFEISKRLWKANVKKPLKFNNPTDIANYYYEELRGLEVEKVMLLMLNSSGGLIKDYIMAMGTVNSCAVGPREALIQCLKYDAASFILIHNHPSGECNPSKEDISLTNKMREAGMIIGIKMLDHIIIGDHKYYSFKEMNYI